MKKKQSALNEMNIRAGEERAFRLFETRVANDGSRWIERSTALKYRGFGREMVRRVFAVARHIEGARLSKSLAEKGVDSVSLGSVRGAIRKIANGLLGRAQRGAGPKSRAGKSLASFIARS